MARRWRLYEPELPDVAGEVVSVGPEESRHARKVLRLRPGEPVALFDGRGHEWLGELLEHDGDTARIRLDRPVDDPVVEPPLEVTLCQAPLRPERMDWVVQKATEVGVSAILVVASERSESYRIGDSRLLRWRRIAVESCKQSGRRRVPRIDPLERLPEAGPGEPPSLLFHPSPGSISVDAQLRGAPPERCRIAVGPQGGFSSDEVAAIEERGWRPTSLGPRVLRADSAGVVAATILLHRWADLGRSDVDAARTGA